MKNYIVVFHSPYGRYGLLVFEIEAIDKTQALECVRFKLLNIATMDVDLWSCKEVVSE